MITIKHRFSDATLCEFDVETIKEAVEAAVKAVANLSGADLSGADLSGANLSRAYLFGADLSGANLFRADLSGADLSGADLSGANLFGADLFGANLFGANLFGADLSRANLSRAYLFGADLSGANLFGADLSRANLDGEILKKNPLAIIGLRYWCLISDGFMRLGCQRHSHQAWAAFSDDFVIAMGGKRVLDFWKQWKVPLLAMCKSHSET